MTNYEIGELVEIIAPHLSKKPENWTRKYIAIVIDNVPRPGRNTIKVFYNHKSTWIGLDWIKKIQIDDNSE